MNDFQILATGILAKDPELITKGDMTTPIPDLERHCGSWVVTAPDGRVFELYERSNVRRAAEAGWQIETAQQYLGRLNREIEERAE